ncbi:MAG: hypothetical protein E7663_04250 [Ruminococcaceae bacterium]|nr:hypothetical protein [Oscillospiraceae bacterium]
MTFASVMALGAKVLGCAVVIYILAGFLVSFKRLLPILAIASGVGTVIAISHIQKNGAESLLWLPIVLSLLTQLFYQGEGYLNPRIHENLYQLVSVERKWNSLFAEYDDYELHFSPVETGGFVENTLLLGILFGLYYNAFIFSGTFSEAAYILPLYFLLMSVLDLLMAFGILRLSAFFYWAARILMIILSVAIAFLAPFSKDDRSLNIEELYEQCAPLVRLDYTTSYAVSYEYSVKSSNGYQPRDNESASFIYDAALDVGAEYDTVSAGRMYDKVYMKNSHFDNKLVQLGNFAPSRLDLDFKFMRYTEEVGGPFKYRTLNAVDFAPYCELTMQKLEHIGGTPIEYNDDEHLLKITYIANYDSTYVPEGDIESYSVIWCFNTDDDRNAVSLSYINFTVYLRETEKQEIRYTPLHDGNTGLDDLFERDGSLKNYTYKEGEIYGIDFNEIISSLNGTSGSFDDYDFKMTETYNNVSSLYAYDAQTGIVALFKTNFANADNALSNEDFTTYPPDYYIVNANRSKYGSDHALIGTQSSSAFKQYTYDDGIASNAISKVFSGTMTLANIVVYVTPNGYLGHIELVDRNEELGVDVTYYFGLSQYMNNDRYYFNSLDARFTYEGREYSMRLYASSNSFVNIPAPSNEK